MQLYLSEMSLIRVALLLFCVGSIRADAIDISLFGADGARLAALNSIIVGGNKNMSEKVVCSSIRPATDEFQFCGPKVDPPLPPFLLKVNDISWPEADTFSSRLYSIMSSLCLPNLVNSNASFVNECRTLAKDFVCLVAYNKCDPLTKQSTPICADFCHKLEACILSDLCKSTFKINCDSAEAMAFVSNDTRICRLPSKRYGTVANATDRPKPHTPGCTFQEKSTHRCARDGYIRLYGVEADVILSGAGRPTFRVQPHNADPEDARVSLGFSFETITAVQSTGLLDENMHAAFGPDLATVVLPVPEINCNFSSIGGQEISYTYRLYGGYEQGGATFIAAFSIHDQNRLFKINDDYTHFVPAGSFKFTFDLIGAPFPGGQWPVNATHLLFRAESSATELPTDWDYIKQVYVNTAIGKLEKGSFRIRFLKMASVDGVPQFLRDGSSETSFATAMLLGKCIKIPAPISIPKFERFHYDPDISFLTTQDISVIDPNEAKNELSRNPNAMINDGFVAGHTNNTAAIVVGVLVTIVVLCIGALIAAFVIKRKREETAAFSIASARISSFNRQNGSTTSLPTVSHQTSQNSINSSSSLNNNNNNMPYNSAMTTNANNSFDMQSARNDEYMSAKYEQSSSSTNTVYQSPIAEIEPKNANYLQYASTPNIQQQPSTPPPKQYMSTNSITSSQYQPSTFTTTSIAQPQQTQPQQQQPTSTTTVDDSLLRALVEQVREAAHGTSSSALAAAVKNLVIAAKPSSKRKELHAQCVLLGREAREAVVALGNNAPLPSDQIRRIEFAANDVARLASQ